MRVISILLLLFLTGCGLVYQKGIEEEGRKFVEKYPGHIWAIERAIKDGRIVPGMTKDEVILSWGKPNRKEETQIGNYYYEKWVYERDRGGKAVGTDILYFRKGILVFWVD